MGQTSVKAILDMDKRVFYIRSLRLEGGWSRKVQRELAEEWGISFESVAKMAAEAGRMIRLQLGPSDEVKAVILARLHRIVEDGDDRDAIKASDTLAKLVGANAPEVDLQTHLLSLSSDERRQYCERLIATCQSIIADLPPATE